MKRVDRRTFLKGAGAASAAAAAGVVVPGIVPSLNPTLVTGGRTGPLWKKAPCRLCGVGCGLLVAVENGRAIAVKGDPDSPVSKGLACVKGFNSVQALYAPDRIKRAMIRRDGALVEVIFRETTTIGLRHHEVERECLRRELIDVETALGTVRIKLAWRDGRVINAVPEFEDCSKLAADHNLPVKDVQAMAVQAYGALHPRVS